MIIVSRNSVKEGFLFKAVSKANHLWEYTREFYFWNIFQPYLLIYNK